VRVVSTVFGDTAVEIISGNGPINTVADNKVLLGLSGDFFSNLAKSMGDVKEILSNVTDVVGTDERRSFERSQSRFPAISEKLDAISTTANKRVAETARRLDKIGEDISKTLNDTSAILETLEPKVNKTSENVKAAFQTMQTSLNETQEEAAKAAKEVNADLEIIRNDVRFAIDESKPNFEAMKNNIRGVYDVMGGLSSRIDGMRRIGGRLLATSGPELSRAAVALKNGLKYLSQTGQAANENKDLMLSMKDVGEYEYNTAVVMYREITGAVRRMRDATSELQATCFKLSELDDAGPRVSQGNFVVGQLNAARAPLEQLQNSVEQTMLPEYERKKTAWNDDPVPAK
jgi:hypothetical protein